MTKECAHKFISSGIRQVGFNYAAILTLHCERCGEVRQIDISNGEVQNNES